MNPVNAPRFVAITLIVLSALQSGCGFTDSRDKAQVRAEEYFATLQAGHIDGALDLYGPAFFEVTARDKWDSQLRNLQSRAGKVQHYELLGWNVNTRAGTNAGTTVTLNYDVTYEHGRTQEQLVLNAKPKGDYAIVGHQFLYVHAPLLPQNATTTI